MANEPIVDIEGYVGAAPDLRMDPNTGRHALVLRVLQTPSRRRGDGWEKLPTIAFDCAVYDDVAENVARSLPTGTRVIVRGRLRGTEIYIPRNGGDPRVTLVVDVERIGPSLRYATADVAKRAHAAEGDDWAIGAGS